MNFKIAKISQSLTTAEEMRNQTKLVMQPYANWEEYLTAPLSIAILGELVFIYISSKTDFSINKNPPRDGYKYIKYPDSFRACLMQVCNSGWWAFNEAHKNMDQIRLHTIAVPDYMKTAVKILFQENDEIVQAHLPDQLENIRVIADDCLALAESTEKRFTDVINIIHELLEACINTEHLYGEELEEIKKRLEEAKMRRKSSKDAIKHSRKVMKNMEEQLKETQESYKKAMDSLPSGWSTMAKDLAGSLIGGVTSVLNGLTAVMSSANPQYKLATNNQNQDSVADAVDKINIYSKSGEILQCAENIRQFVQENSIDWTKMYDQKNQASKTDFFSEQFNRINSNLQKLPQCKSKEHAQELCKEGIDICRELATHAPQATCSETKTMELINKIKSLFKLAITFDSTSKNVTKSHSLTAKPPLMYREQSALQENTYQGRASQYNVEQTRVHLNSTRDMYEKSVENMEKNQKELTEILITMRNCKVKEIDFNTNMQMLVKGMDAMGRVKEQWEKMVRFFQMVSNIVKISLSRTLKDFASTSEKTLSYNSKLFSKDLIYSQAFQASNITSLIHMISATYTEVSDKYLMDRVSSLGKLMAMDKTKPEFEQEQKQLRESCDETQKAILDLVRENKDEFERKCDLRLERIDKELLAILPAPAPEEIKSIQAAVSSGFTEDEENDEEAGYY